MWTRTSRPIPGVFFVAEEDGKILGYISTRLEGAKTGKGRIPNLAVDKSARGRGLGRQLIEHAVDYFRREGMDFVMIETMANKPVGQSTSILRAVLWRPAAKFITSKNYEC